MFIFITFFYKTDANFSNSFYFYFILWQLLYMVAMKLYKQTYCHKWWNP
jgi:hypothetical protein